MMAFVRTNLRWLAAGFLLTFASAFGQTWFISLFAGAIKSEYGLTDGAWGSLYTVATLSAAGLMFWRGAVADTVRLSRLAPVMAGFFALAGIGMASAGSVWLLGLSLFLLRFCGQGMFSHIAMTAMGRWFEATRGRAVSISSLGHPAGEIVVPVLTVLCIAAIGWRPTWIVVAAILCLVIAPAFWFLLKDDRSPQGHTGAMMVPGLHGRHWRRQDAARHWLLPALLPVLLTPGFIGTVVFFQQVHIAEVKGWTLVQMAPGYSAFATATVASAFVAGWAADRFGAQRLLSVLLIPMGIGIALIGPADQVAAWWVALGVIGITQGTASALWGVLLPVAYGTRHLGSIRSLATTVMVIATAIGPGITGILIDRGVDFPTQTLFMSAWCLVLTAGCILIDRRLTRELLVQAVPEE
ncbi:MFS transporter [Halovulum dunhuangense]|uniref:MFS transporter n=1 Tax=Halovulum dunhuangense TaxID=1505036 RepID=A0A849L6M6_9RHOB|nr:MFS transporter [Halovulum dunhuangense]NNU82105.1 MFS transporter [Halovulum dunhuangense]